MITHIPNALQHPTSPLQTPSSQENPSEIKDKNVAEHVKPTPKPNPSSMPNLNMPSPSSSSSNDTSSSSSQAQSSPSPSFQSVSYVTPEGGMFVGIYFHSVV